MEGSYSCMQKPNAFINWCLEMLLWYFSELEHSMISICIYTTVNDECWISISIALIQILHIPEFHFKYVIKYLLVIIRVIGMQNHRATCADSLLKRDIAQGISHYTRRSSNVYVKAESPVIPVWWYNLCWKLHVTETELAYNFKLNFQHIKIPIKFEKIWQIHLLKQIYD